MLRESGDGREEKIIEEIESKKELNDEVEGKFKNEIENEVNLMKKDLIVIGGNFEEEKEDL